MEAASFLPLCPLRAAASFSSWIWGKGNPGNSMQTLDMCRRLWGSAATRRRQKGLGEAIGKDQKDSGELLCQDFCVLSISPFGNVITYRNLANIICLRRHSMLGM